MVNLYVVLLLYKLCPTFQFYVEDRSTVNSSINKILLDVTLKKVCNIETTIYIDILQFYVLYL